MTKKKRNETRVGLFITLGLGLFILALFLMGTLDVFLTNTTTVEADFSDIQSLQVGDPVLLFGQRVGKVTSIDLLPFEEEKLAVIRVGLRLPAGRLEHLRDNSIVKVDKSLTGNISVLIQEGPTPGRRLGKGARLMGVPIADLGTVTEKAKQVIDAGEQVVAAISQVVSEIQAKGDIPKAVSGAAEIVQMVKSDLAPLAAQLRQALDAARGFIDENRLDVRHAVANLKETSTLAKSLTEKLNAAPQQIESGLAQLEKAGKEISSMVEENRVHVDSILEDLRSTMTNASGITAEVKRRPWRLLYRPTEAEAKAMELYDAAWAYNLGATELNRSIRDLAARLESDSADPRRTEELEDARKQVAQSLRKHREAEDRFWEKLRAGE